MPVPFETLLPYGIMIAMFGVTGTGLAALKSYQNGGRNPRYSVDQWDKFVDAVSKPPYRPHADDDLVMDRDRRLTGSLRGQVAEAVAPAGFELNNPWKLEKRFL